MSKTENENWIQNLRERKLMPYLGSYLAIGFALLQFLQFISERYDLNKNWVDIYLMVWLILFPSVAIISYFGWDILNKNSKIKWPKIIVGINVFILVGILSYYAYNNYASNTKDRYVEYVDESGNTVKALVPKLDNVKTVACFQFKNDSENKEDDWWGFAFSQLLCYDLDQRPEYYVRNAYSFVNQLKGKNLNLFEVPSVAVQKQLAQDNENAYFTNISYNKSDEVFHFKGNLYETKSGKNIVEINVTEKDPYLAIDKISKIIINSIPNPLKNNKDITDVPASIFVSENQDALKALTLSYMEYYKNPSNLDIPLKFAQEAVELDPMCSYCYLRLARIQESQGNRDEAIKSTQKAVKLANTLPKRLQFDSKLKLYSMTDNLDAQITLMEMYKNMFPYDFNSYENLINLYKINKGLDSTKILINEAIENGNFEKGTDALFILQSSYGEYEEAEESINKLIKAFPDKKSYKQKLAYILSKKGELDEAKSIINNAIVLDPFNSSLITQLADIEFRNGNVDKAFKVIQNGMENAENSQDSMIYIFRKYFYNLELGKLNEAQKLLSDYEKKSLKYQSASATFNETFTDNITINILKGNKTKIIELLNSSLTDNKNNSKYCSVNFSSIINTGKEFFPKERLEECSTYFQSFGPGYEDFIQFLSTVQEKNYPEAIKLLEKNDYKLLKFLNDDYYTFLISTIYEKTGEHKKAVKMVQKSVDAKSILPINYLQLALLLENDEPEESKIYLNKALSYWKDADKNFIYLAPAIQLKNRLGN